MNYILSKDDCAEIYHALGFAHATNLQARVGHDGENLASGKVYLFKRDATIIYQALMDKRARILEGAYDSYDGEVKQVGSITYELAEQFGRILTEIGDRGENLLPPMQIAV